MLEIEVIGLEAAAVAGPSAVEVEELCALALSSAGIDEGHVAIEFVDEERIRELNSRFRGLDAPTDVLSFGVDEDDEVAGPRELGDIVICPAHTEDMREAVLHGALHLTGMDHERDDGEEHHRGQRREREDPVPRMAGIGHHVLEVPVLERAARHRVGDRQAPVEPCVRLPDEVVVQVVVQRVGDRVHDRGAGHEHDPEPPG